MTTDAKINNAAKLGTLTRRIDVAAGRAQADMLITNARVANVFTAEIIAGEVAIVDGFIAAVGSPGSYSCANTIDAKGRIVAPGLIDAHMHLESVMVRPSEFARAAVTHGTLGVIADPHEIANVCGKAGIEFILRDTEDLPMDVWLMIPSCVPATAFESSGATLEAADIAGLVDRERVRGLGEMMNYPGIINADSDTLEKLLAVDESRRQVIDGHSPWVSGKDLSAYATAGIRTDHECATVEQMQERLRAGMYVQVREGSACRNLNDLIVGVSADNASRCLFCTDDKHPEDISERGHIDNCLRMAIAAGLDPMLALRMATLNVAQCYNLLDVGAVAPGYRANLLLLDELDKFQIDQVIFNGEVVAEQGKALFAAHDFKDEAIFSSVNIAHVAKADLALPLVGSKAHVIGVLPHSVETEHLVMPVATADGQFVCDAASDVLKVAVFERHHATGNVGVGLLSGFGLKGGAIASTVAHDSHNLIVVGDNDDDMLTAVERIKELQGGVVLVAGGKVLSELALPIAGLMSDAPIEDVETAVKELRSAAYALGVHDYAEPLMTLAFMALPVIPALKLTDKGLFDVTQFKLIPVEAG